MQSILQEKHAQLGIELFEDKRFRFDIRPCIDLVEYKLARRGLTLEDYWDPKSLQEAYVEPLTIFAKTAFNYDSSLRKQVKMFTLLERAKHVRFNLEEQTETSELIRESLVSIMENFPEVHWFKMHYKDYFFTIVVWKTIEDQFEKLWMNLKHFALIFGAIEPRFGHLNQMAGKLKRLKDRLEELDIVVFVNEYNEELLDVLEYEKFCIGNYSEFRSLKTVNFSIARKPNLTVKDAMSIDYNKPEACDGSGDPKSLFKYSVPFYSEAFLPETSPCKHVTKVTGNILWKSPESFKYFMKTFPSLKHVDINTSLDAECKHFLQNFTLISATNKDDMVKFMTFILNMKEFHVSELYSESSITIIYDLLDHPVVDYSLTIRHQLINHCNHNMDASDSQTFCHKVEPYFTLKSRFFSLGKEGLPADINEDNALTLNVGQQEEMDWTPYEDPFRLEFQMMIKFLATRGLKKLSFVVSDKQDDLFPYLCGCGNRFPAYSNCKTLWPLLFHDFLHYTTTLNSLSWAGADLSELNQALESYETQSAHFTNSRVQTLTISDSLVFLSSLSKLINIKLPYLKKLELIGCQYPQFFLADEGECVKATLTVGLADLSLDHITFMLPEESGNDGPSTRFLVQITVSLPNNLIYERCFDMGERWSPISNEQVAGLILDDNDNYYDLINLDIVCHTLNTITLVGSEERGSAGKAFTLQIPNLST